MENATLRSRHLPGPPMNPGTRLFVTPPFDVDPACRIALSLFIHSRFASQLGSREPVPSAGSNIVTDLGLDSDDAELSSLTSVLQAREIADVWAVRQRPLQVWRALYRLRILDPACGEGHFLLGMLRALTDLRAAIGAQTLYHADPHVREAGKRLGVNDDLRLVKRQVATNNLYGLEVAGTRILRARSLLETEAFGAGSDSRLASHLRQGDAFLFPWPELDEGFDLVIGNPPFVRHEWIHDPAGKIPPAEYKRGLEKVIYRRFPAFFGWNEARGIAKRPLDRRADLGALFTLLGLSLTRPGGVLTFVLPSALFQAQYGARLKEVLSREAQITVLERSQVRSFAAGVNTLTLMGLKNRVASNGASNEIGTDFLLRPHRSPNSPYSPGHGGSLTEDLLNRVNHVAPLGSLGRLRYPIKTGINRFFYPSREAVAAFGIEPEYLQPILRSPRDVTRIKVERGDLGTVLFHCQKTAADLQAGGSTGALAYIEWGAAQQTARGTPWPSVPSVANRKVWYSITVPEPAHIICPRFFDRRFFFLAMDTRAVEDQTFYGLVIAEYLRHEVEVMAAVLNSSLVYLFLETHGRTGLGEGVRQYALCDFSSLPVPDPRSVSEEQANELKMALARLCSRPILPVEEEMHQPDRYHLDTLVAMAFGLTNRDMESVRAELQSLTSQRLLRARTIIAE